MTTPTHLRDAGIAQAEQHADPRLIAAVDVAIENFAALGCSFSADDIRPHVPTAALHLVGGRVRSYLMRRNPQVLVKVGEVVSTWPATHAKRIGLYVGADHVGQVAS